MSQSKEKNNQGVAQDVMEGMGLVDTTCVVTAQTTLSGDFDCATDLRLDGVIEGNVRVKKRIVVGEEGRIDGNVTANHLIVHGLVKGDINVAGDVVLGATATLEGNVKAGRMLMEEGAVLSGEISIGKSSTIPGADI